ncbi:hypothetical protein ABT174_33765 [Streptomyces sparsogenes]|uniref:hypothetical protein n=1 Tax=Streptomyces sparsogenes TaxID=67365 RepID=UPI00331A0C94
MTRQTSNTVSVIDTATNTVTVGDGATGGVITPGRDPRLCRVSRLGPGRRDRHCHEHRHRHSPRRHHPHPVGSHP